LLVLAFAWAMPTAATEQPRSRARVLSVKHEPRVLNNGQTVERRWYDPFIDEWCGWWGNVMDYCPVPVKDPKRLTPPVDVPQR
jgi:hypothetical protein